MSRTALYAHRASVVLMGVAVLAATGVGFTQSWAGLYGWAIEHGLSEWKAMSFPAMVDLFIAVGEIGLFALALEGHRLSRRGLSWLDLAAPAAVAVGGWAVSLAFNVGHVGDNLAEQVTAAVAPVASMLGLLVLLRTLHRLVTRTRPPAAELMAEPGRPVADEAEGVADEDPDDHQGDDDGRSDLRPEVAEPPIELDLPLEERVVVAYAMGVSQRRIAKEYGITRHRVADILKEAATDVAEVADDRPPARPRQLGRQAVAAGGNA